MADINKLMQIINALEANGTDVEGILGSLLTPVPMPQQMQPDNGMQPVPMPSPMQPDNGMQPVPMGRPLTQEEQLMEIRRRMMDMSPGPGMGSISQGEMMNRMPQMQPGTGGISQRDMDMMLRRMPGQGQSRSGILDLLQRMR
jgi:hypothetical protein